MAFPVRNSSDRLLVAIRTSSKGLTGDLSSLRLYYLGSMPDVRLMVARSVQLSCLHLHLHFCPSPWAGSFASADAGRKGLPRHEEERMRPTSNTFKNRA